MFLRPTSAEQKTIPLRNEHRQMVLLFMMVVNHVVCDGYQESLEFIQLEINENTNENIESVRNHLQNLKSLEFM